MRVVKSGALSVLTRPFQTAAQRRFGISWLLPVSLVAPVRLGSEVELWKLAADELGSSPVLCEGIPRSRAEILVAGRAFPPEAPATTCPVRVRVGEIDKALDVVGDRAWRDDGVQTAQVPFEQMPITWERAFGGAGYEKNPLGRGMPGEASEPVRLPNVEKPGRLIRGAGERPEPQGFLPYGFMWPQRAFHRGTYDQAWLETRFPGFADDLDWRMWQMAPADQQQEEPFVGDEAIELLHLHPTRPTLKARLPDLRVRCFVSRAAAHVAAEPDPTQLTELETRLMTIWLFPHRERAVLVYQTHCEVEEDDARDVGLLLGAVERRAAPRPIEHYVAVAQKRSALETRGRELLNEGDVAPIDLVGPQPHEDTGLRQRGLLGKNVRRGMTRRVEEARAELEADGHDPDEYGLKLPEEEPDYFDMPFDELMALGDRAKREADAKVEELRVQLDEARAQALERVAAAEVDPSGMDPDTESSKVGPPSFTADAQRERLRQAVADAEEAGAPIPALREMAEDPAQYAQWQDNEAQAREAYRMAAHVQQPVDGRPLDEALCAELVEAARSGASMARRDLTGARLEGLDLRGIDLRGAWLEAASLVGTDLRGANLADAVFAHADLTGARLEGARVTKANLGACTLTAAKADAETDFGEAVLSRANLSGAQLLGCRLAGAHLHEAILEGAILRGAILTQVHFIELSMRGCDFEGADLSKSNLLKCDLREARFDDATLADVNLIESDARGASFVRAKMPQARIIWTSKLAGCNFSRADLTSCNFRGVGLSEANLSGAIATGADFSEADLTDANLFAIGARGARFDRTVLRRAKLVGADLLGAFFTHAVIRAADFTDANLFGADLALVDGDEATRFDGADRERIRIYPKRST